VYAVCVTSIYIISGLLKQGMTTVIGTSNVGRRVAIWAVREVPRQGVK
jgi:hypothetical protein